MIFELVKVYMVVEDKSYYEADHERQDYFITKIFNNRKSAEEYCKKMNEENNNEICDVDEKLVYRVEEHIVHS